MQDKYKWIGPAYDFLSTVYGGKSIHNCKRAMLTDEHVKPGDKILIAGVGHGKDAIRAAEMGADVTVVDLSETMLKKLQQAIDNHPADLKINKVHSDILEFGECDHYDMVIANFFLNVFYPDLMSKILGHLITLVKPERGKMVIGDFSYPQGNIVKRNLQKCYWYIAALIFYFATDNALHQIYNYPELLKQHGLTIKDRKDFSYLGLRCYTSVLGERASFHAEGMEQNRNN
ncbi:MAG: SAM-dependent methyltransferase [Gammaproteobacteria bacterium]|nr:MAG: SAM-dependent methyltransferase [Gammaproteobacteria bacterium]